MKTILDLLRVKQWIKNLFIWAPLIFSLKLFSAESLYKTLITFFAFCFIAVLVYIINDVKDKKCDSHHPVKSKRPIASGKIPVNAALFIGLVFAAASIGLSLLVSPKVTAVIIGYLVLNLLYTFFFKYMVILDVFIIALGFCMRVFIGSVAINVVLSHWMMITTFSVSLLLGFGKRRHELILLHKKAFDHRSILGEYSKEILDIMIIISTAITAIGYALYTMDSSTIDRFHTSSLIYTVPFVLFGLFRYLFLVYNKEKGGKPEEVVVSDPELIITVVLWLVTTGCILYMPHLNINTFPLSLAF